MSRKMIKNATAMLPTTFNTSHMIRTVARNNENYLKMQSPDLTGIGAAPEGLSGYPRSSGRVAHLSSSEPRLAS